MFFAVKTSLIFRKVCLAISICCLIAVSDQPSDEIVCPRYFNVCICSRVVPSTFISTLGFSGSRLITIVFVFFILILKPLFRLSDLTTSTVSYRPCADSAIKAVSSAYLRFVICLPSFLFPYFSIPISHHNENKSTFNEIQTQYVDNNI